MDIVRRCLFIIPARGGSKRLPRKNLRKVCGRPMIEWVIDACRNSAFNRSDFLNDDPGRSQNVFVTSEDAEIIATSHNAGARVIVRPEYLADDHVWTQDVLRHAVDKVKEIDPDLVFNTVVRVQANSPQVTSAVIDSCIMKIRRDDLNEVFTVNRETLNEDAAVHAMKDDVVYQEALSVYKGIILTDYIDIHNGADLERVQRIMLGPLNLDGEIK